MNFQVVVVVALYWYSIANYFQLVYIWKKVMYLQLFILKSLVILINRYLYTFLLTTKNIKRRKMTELSCEKYLLETMFKTHSYINGCNDVRCF